ncbi:hypothetical protein LMG18096_03578 [Ralstonia holmesii]|uniref:Uncharacterized protein n=1 Tax=Ralstonia holmesii TaxID=3058602 RepID=A0ABC8QF59_9RALS|nr:hypothetical protein LMG18096_03578 [Ralstonia sp. LMG 32967]CAJ0806839.1 hypothetical protein LMG18093_00255 [Ralstonia sp. LMG 32967]
MQHRCQINQNINQFWRLAGEVIGQDLPGMEYAARIGVKALGDIGDRHTILKLPSSSPAYAAVPYAKKLVAWQALRGWLS